MKLLYPLLFLLLTGFLTSGCAQFLSNGNKNWKLATAAANADTATFEKRLNQVQDLNARPTLSKLDESGSSTILMIAAYGSSNPQGTEDTRMFLIRQLIEKGANPFLTDAAGRTAADYARLSGSFKIAFYLENYGKKRASPQGINGKS